MEPRSKLLMIGNYPPPVCGWAMQIKLTAEELRLRGQTCEILNINENRRKKQPGCLDVQNGFDYLVKITRYAASGYRLNPHVNGQSKKGYVLALLAELAGRLTGRGALLTFHGGLAQAYFPGADSSITRVAFRLLFEIAGGISCDGEEIRNAILEYGVSPRKVISIPTFSSQYLRFEVKELSSDLEEFLGRRSPIFFCYVSFRPEYELEMLRESMARFRRKCPQAGFIWLGFPAKELPDAVKFVSHWRTEEREGVHVLGNLPHDEFLTLMSRCTACIRTPACDGVAASVLESLTLGIPVIASDNGSRPAGTLLHQPGNCEDLTEKLFYLTENYAAIRDGMQTPKAKNSISAMSDWLSGKAVLQAEAEIAHAR